SSPDPQALLRLLQEHLGLPEEADAETVVAAMSEALDVTAANASAAPSPLEWVPIGEYRRVCQELSALDNRLSLNQAEQYVDNLLEHGRIFPFQRDWAISVCRADMGAMEKWVAEVGPQTRAFLTPILDRTPPSRQKNTMDDGRLAVCSAMGIDPSELRTLPEET
ncbi:phage protease, partial [Roseospira navarrensis]